MSNTTYLYKDPRQSTEARVNDLLGLMTLEEKVAQLGSIWVYEVLTNGDFDNGKAQALMELGLGQVTRLGGASNSEPRQSAVIGNRVQAFLVKETRLGIPAIVHEECCSGYMARGATLFPQAIGVASSWEPELAEKMAEVVRAQMRAVGAHQALSPVLDVTRDPRWGRVEETYGEDPYLVASMGVGFVRGVQGESFKDGVLATAKHFLGYGLPEGGMNWAPAHIPERELLEVFAFPFEAAIKEANLASVMNAYHELDGLPCGASRALLTGLLREKLGFGGLLVSDYFAVDMLKAYHYLTADPVEAACLALEAGIDVELPSTDLYKHLVDAVKGGRIAQSLIDTAVKRNLEAKVALGLFEEPYVPEDRAPLVFDTPEQRQLAHELAEKSVVLLKNDHDLLPLAKDLSNLAVIGPNADTVRNLLGDYTYPAHIESLIEMSEMDNVFGTPIPDKVEAAHDFLPITSILDAIRQKVSEGTQVHYAKGCDILGDDTSGFDEAIHAAKRSDVALLFVGGKSGLTDDCTSGEARDLTDLALTGTQEDLVRAVYKTGTPVALVLVGGRPVTLGWMADELPAIVQAWLPGEEGGAALSDLLFGDANPAGRLPISIPRSVGQIPVYYNHKPSGGRSHWKGDYVDGSSAPLYPFGYGLSYTQFRYSDLELDSESATANGSIDLSFSVTNIGQRGGDEVVQLYVRDLYASVTRPVKELKGYKRLRIEPGESKRVTFTLFVNQLAFYDKAMRCVVEPGKVRVMVGSSSEEIHLESAFQVTGETTPVHSRTFFSRVKVG